MNKFVLLFPGQGSQYVGMAQSFLKDFEPIFSEAEEALSLPIRNLMFEGPLEKLTETAIAQPAILLHSVIAYNYAKKQELDVSYAVGHSLGEYSALVAAGVLNLFDALKIVHKRGLLMQEAVPKGHGGMAAVFMDVAEIEDALKEFSEKDQDYVSIANYNGPAQTVIAGTKSGIEKASSKLKSLGAKRIIELSVSAPFHCALMKPVALKMTEVLSGFKFHDAKFPIITNVKAKPESNGEAIKKLLLEQINSPVRFTGCIEFIMKSLDSRSYLELGPKNILCGLVKKIDCEAKFLNIDKKESEA
jgi:[acyl-carrier-protein] S-malonyltransferase